MTASQSTTPSESIEAVASEAALAAGEALRVVEVATAVFLGLLICPPLMILVVVVGVPLIALGLVAAVLSTPFLLVHALRGHHRGHGSLLVHRLRVAGRALIDLAPHRIVAEVRRLGPGR